MLWRDYSPVMSLCGSDSCVLMSFFSSRFREFSVILMDKLSVSSSSLQIVTFDLFKVSEFLDVFVIFINIVLYRPLNVSFN